MNMRWVPAVLLLLLVVSPATAQERARRTPRNADRFTIVWKDDRTAVNKTVTFSARNISLKEALDIVTELTGTKYRIRGSTVRVVPEHDPDDRIVVRMYNVLPNVGQRLKSVGMDIGRR